MNLILSRRIHNSAFLLLFSLGCHSGEGSDSNASPTDPTADSVDGTDPTADSAGGPPAGTSESSTVLKGSAMPTMGRRMLQSTGGAASDLGGSSAGGVSTGGAPDAGLGGEPSLGGSGATGTGGLAGGEDCGAIDLGSSVGEVVSHQFSPGELCREGYMEPSTYRWMAPYSGTWKVEAISCAREGDPNLVIRKPACDGEIIEKNDDGAGLFDGGSRAEFELAGGELVTIHLNFLNYPEWTGTARPTALRIYEGDRPTESDCSDGVDEDFDDRLDCYDPDCKYVSVCCEHYFEDCP